MNVIPLQKSIVYGPVASRRLGRSLGLNISPPGGKLCTFDCVYCHYGRRAPVAPAALEAACGFPSPDDVAVALAGALRETPPPAYITFSGNGEPTLHPAFGDVVAAVRGARDRLAPGARLAVLSNASTLSDAGVRDVLSRLDTVILKLDAGTAAVWEAINAPASAVRFEDVVAALAAFDGYTLQSCFVDGVGSNAGEDALEAYVAVVARLRPRRVQLYTTDRPVGTAGVRKVAAEKLAEIARRLRDEVGVAADVF